MASWKDSVNRMAQSAVAKSKEVAESTRLNLDINTQQQKIMNLYAVTGEYVMTHPELVSPDDETFAEGMKTLAELNEKISQDRDALLALRGSVLCEGCGAEVSRDSNFCSHCGAPIILPAEDPEEKESAEQPAEEAADPVVVTEEDETFCPSCGTPVDNDADFCPGCSGDLKPDGSAE